MAGFNPKEKRQLAGENDVKGAESACQRGGGPLAGRGKQEVLVRFESVPRLQLCVLHLHTLSCVPGYMFAVDSDIPFISGLEMERKMGVLLAGV